MCRIISLVSLCFSLVLVAACSPQVSGSINVERLEALLAEGVPLVDIRVSAQQRKTGIIEHSYLVTVFDSHDRVIPDSFDKITKIVGGKDQPVILIDDTGRRAGVAAKALTEQLGYTKVYNVASGIIGWQANQKPLVPVP